MKNKNTYIAHLRNSNTNIELSLVTDLCRLLTFIDVLDIHIDLDIDLFSETIKIISEFSKMDLTSCFAKEGRWVING